ncbi:MAG TPA: hypothetical protein VIM07_15005 [Chitinophagaceae bacterium]
MIAVDFPQRNLMLAEDQPEYETLPVFCEMKEVIVPNKPNDPQLAIMTKNVPWTMTAYFALNKEEIDEIVRTGKIWHKQCLFGGDFQPIMMSTQNPFEEK